MLLITTALEESWGIDEPLCILGEWCCLYSRKDVLSCRSYKILPYHWDDRQKVYADFKYLQILNARLIEKLTPILNELHTVNYSERSWNLLIGYWLTQFSAIILDRWTMIDLAITEHSSLETIVLFVKYSDLAPNDCAEAGSYFLDDAWNHRVCSEIISKWTDIKIKSSLDVNISEKSIDVDVDVGRQSIFAKGKSILRKLINKLSGFSTKNNHYVFCSTGLGLWHKLKLEVSLGMFPTHTQFPDATVITYDPQFRNWKASAQADAGQFETILCRLLPMCMPKTFLEGFRYIRNSVDSLRLAKSPKVIFTSNNHFSNDLFKIWAMEKIESGSRLVLGQHGGGAFHKFNGATSFELSVCDAYITTGNGNGNGNDLKPNIYHLGRFNSKLKMSQYSHSGNAILMTTAMPRFSFDLRSMVIAGQMQSYYEDQFDFYSALAKNIRQQLLVRVYPDGDYGWDQIQRWKDRFPGVLIDEGKMQIKKQIRSCRLSISTYNATTYNETLASNIPTVIYWDTELWEISAPSKPYFERLKDAGIFHESPESAARHINKHWDGIPDWWNSIEVQEARKVFCDQYALIAPNILSSLKSSLQREMQISSALMSHL